MTWAARRRLFILFLLALFIGGLVFWHETPNIFRAPTCSDGKQNGDEQGIDCGGTMCTVMCTSQIQLPTVLWARSFAVTSNVYNAAAYIENKNNAATRQIAYEFRLYDANNILISRRDGVTLIPPLGNFVVVETGIQSGMAAVAHTTFDFSSAPAVWERVPAVAKGIAVGTSNVSLDTTDPIPKLSLSVSDPSPSLSLKNTVVAAVLYDASDNAVNVSRTIIPSLKPGSSTPVVFTWPSKLSAPVVRYEILPVIDVFDVK